MYDEFKVGRVKCCGVCRAVYGWGENERFNFVLDYFQWIQ